jgi:hypothetical protein
VISKKAIAICAAFGVAFTGTSLAVPAVADPVSNTFAIVGSDTLEGAVNTLVNGPVDEDLRTLTTEGKSMGSFDATGSSCIQTKPNKAPMSRPNGSSDGIKALSRSILGTAYQSAQTLCVEGNNKVISGYVDIARSSSTATENTGGALYNIPFGRDAIAYAYHSGSTATGIATLTKAQITEIFKCDFADTSIIPVLPQAGSGTRKDFLSKLSIADDATLELKTNGGCIEVGQEHDGTSLTAANKIMPMSASRWVAMNTGMYKDLRGSAVIAGIQGPGFSAAPVTGTGVNMVPNQAYYDDTTWGRETWLVVEYARIDSTNLAKYDAKLAAVVDATISDSLANVTMSTTNKAKSGYWKLKNGFLAPKSGVTPFRSATS